MPLLGIFGVIGWNYSVHRRRLRACPTGCDHWPHRTICATFRRYVPRWAVIPFWSAVTGYMIPHLWRGYPRRT